MARSGWFSNTNRVHGAVMLIRRLGRHMLLGGMLVVGSFSAVAADKASPIYTADLNQWGPGENKLKALEGEPRFAALQYAEKYKIIGCLKATDAAFSVITNTAAHEATADVLARNGGLARDQPFGKLAENEFRYMVLSALGINKTDEWPQYNKYGEQVAMAYALHFGYQFWEEGHKGRLASPPLFDKKLEDSVTEQFWPLCLAQVPTACFEEGEVDRERCLPGLIHPRDFPNYELTSDLFNRYLMTERW